MRQVATFGGVTATPSRRCRDGGAARRLLTTCTPYAHHDESVKLQNSGKSSYSEQIVMKLAIVGGGQRS